jgi:hypothetical protein
MNFDLTTFAGLTAAVLALVSAIKAGWPTWTAGREPRLALATGLLFGLAAHVAQPALFAAGLNGWIAAALQGIGAGIAAQVAHDKALNVIGRRDDPPPPEK